MNFARFYATRVTFGRRRLFRRLSVNLALISIGLGVTVMNVAVAIVYGFEEEITHKVAGFAGDLEIQAFNLKERGQRVPLQLSSTLLDSLLQEIPEATRVNPYVQYEGMFQGPLGHEGMRCYGVRNFPSEGFFSTALRVGTLPELTSREMSREVLVSEMLARDLGLSPGKRALLMFYQDGKARFRKVTVSGLYATGLAEFDQHVVVCDIRLLQQLLGWAPQQVDGYHLHLERGSWFRDGDYELRLSEDLSLPVYPPGMRPLNEIGREVDRLLPYNQSASPVTERFAELFNWMDLQHQNVEFILILMIAVGVVNILVAVLILVTENTRRIGLLKAVGASHRTLRNIVRWQAFYLVLIGIGGGIGFSFLLMLLQDQTGLLQLDPEAYFVDTVPIGWPVGVLLFADVLMLLFCLLAISFFSAIVRRIRPVKALRFA